MREDDVLLLIQVLRAMKELCSKIDTYYKGQDIEKLASAKREMLSLQKKVEGILR